MLAMFEAVVDNLCCAAHIQRDLAKQNDDLPEDRRVWFRIGVDLGDVNVERGDIYADGVNVAERLARPGDICISEAVHSAAGKKLTLVYEYKGNSYPLAVGS